jgi:Fur family ferric uptake transcriptional regulator
MRRTVLRRPHTARTRKRVEPRDTSQRRAIREALERAGRPLSAHEILRAAKTSVPRLGIATVYRAVKQLHDVGLLHQVTIPGGVPRYEPSGKRHHHHFHCRLCGRVYEVDACPGELTHLAPAGFSLEAHEVILYGRCAGCARKGRNHRGAGRRGRRGQRHNAG